ncbi:MAG: hypothetical protein M3341_15040, partial [Actinomycetota bacterium]|nr:hypothetical protein [Actinomycetota bacterium]
MPPNPRKTPKGIGLRRRILPAAMSKPPVTAPDKTPKNTARAAYGPRKAPSHPAHLHFALAHPVG